GAPLPPGTLAVMASRDEILAALGNVIDPELRRPVTELEMVRGVELDGGRVEVTIALTVAGCPLRSSFEDQVREHVASLPGVDTVDLHFDGESCMPRCSTPPRRRVVNAACSSRRPHA